MEDHRLKLTWQTLWVNNNRKNQDHPHNRVDEIGHFNQKSPWDLWRVVVTQTAIPIAVLLPLLQPFLRCAYDKFPDFFRKDTFIDSTHRKPRNLPQLQCTCSTVPTTPGKPHGSPLVWECQSPSSQPLSSPQLFHNDSLWAKGITKSHREQGLDYREGEQRSWCPSLSNSRWQGWSCGLVHCPGGNATDPFWRVVASSQGISCWTPLKPQHSNPNHNPLANQLWCIDFLTPLTRLIIPHRLPTFLESLMPLKNWCSIHARWLKSSLKHSIRFCGNFFHG